jgi:hypothetical protein
MEGGIAKPLPPYICPELGGIISNGIPENSCGLYAIGVDPGYMEAGDCMPLLVECCA